MKKLLFLFLFSLPCLAEEAFISYGVGSGASAIKGSTETVVGSIGYVSDIWYGFCWEFRGGYWKDRSGIKVRKSSAFISSGPSLLIDLKPVEIKSGWALAAITTPDAYLGGSFPQFQGHIYLGLRDKKGNGIGVQFNHFSSADIHSPNVGRDFYMLQLSQKW